MSLSDSHVSTEILLDTLLPGFGLLSRLLSFYLNIDASAYAVYIFIILLFWIFATFALPALFDRLAGFFLRYAASVDILFQDALYGQTMDWIAQHDQLSQTRRCIAGTRTNYTSPWRRKESQDKEDADAEEDASLEKIGQEQGSENKHSFWRQFRYLNKRKSIWYTPRKDDYHIFWHEGCILAIRRKSFGDDKRDSFHSFMENITIYTAPWNRQRLGALIEDIQKRNLEKKSNQIDVYRGMKLGDYQWVLIAPNVHRSMDTVILDPGQKSAFEADVQDFLLPSTSQWYAAHNLNYRRGYLFHGPPGTGKSSLALAIATFFGLDIYMFSLNSLDENGLALLLQGLPRRCVVLLEDIDTAGLGPPHNYMNAHSVEALGNQPLSLTREDLQLRNGPITLSSLLNELDGVSTKAGRILIMTTNRKNNLDSALLRPGRVDMQVEFGLASSVVVRNQFVNFYAPWNHPNDSAVHQLSKESCPSIDDGIDALATDFAKLIPGGKFTQAEIQNYLLRHRKDPASAVARAREWSASKLGVSSLKSHE